MKFLPFFQLVYLFTSVRQICISFLFECINFACKVKIFWVGHKNLKKKLFLNLLGTSNTMWNFFQIFVVFSEYPNFIACYWLSSFSSWCAKKASLPFFNLAQHHLHFIFGLYFFQDELVYISFDFCSFLNISNKVMAIDQIEETGIKFFKQCNSLCNGAKTSWNGILYKCDFRILFLQILSLFPTCR